MPKLKTRKSVKKRFKLSARGKVRFSKTGRRHLLTDKTSDKKRRLRSEKAIDRTDLKRVIRNLPYW